MHVPGQNESLTLDQVEALAAQLTLGEALFTRSYRTAGNFCRFVRRRQNRCEALEVFDFQHGYTLVFDSHGAKLIQTS
jgi:hypothetical protein